MLFGRTSVVMCGVLHALGYGRSQQFPVMTGCWFLGSALVDFAVELFGVAASVVGMFAASAVQLVVAFAVELVAASTVELVAACAVELFAAGAV